MKITFIQPYYFNVWEALGIGYLASFCKRYIPTLEMNFFQAHFDDDATIIEGSRESDFIAFSCTSPTFRHGVELAKKIRLVNPKCKTIFGGNHVSAIPTLLNETVIDHIVVGEGESALLKILMGAPDPIIHGETLPFDKLIHPDRDLIRNDRTIDLCEKIAGIRSTSFLAHRGCPFRCKYCAERTISGTGKIRTRNITDTLNEIEKVQRNCNLNFFKFADATFDSSPKWVSEFCDEKVRRKNTLPWECMIHANCATEDMIKSLKKANCKQICVGCESGSPKILHAMNKGVTREKIIDVFDWAKKHGVERRAFFILGMPEETMEDVDQTESLVERLQPDVFGITILCPYPGCSLYDHVRFKDVDWSKTDEYSNDFWSTKNFTNAELKANQKRLTDKYAKTLNWHQRHLDNIK